uniref:T9SS type A sorting domain-containing protein n=1 Tax=candidate division WOR-3 bacterium TaxID=2052148 RepID=A0A7C4Y9S3_UNCW3
MMILTLFIGITYSSPVIDGVIGNDWENDEKVIYNTIPTNWSGNSLDTLFITFSSDSLYIGIKGRFTSNSGNCILIYLDRDFYNDDTTGGFNNRWDFSDESGNLDQSISGLYPSNVPVRGFYADFVIGSKDENDISPDGYSDYAGMRELKFQSRQDFPWISGVHIVVNDSVFESAISFNSIYPSGIPQHSRIALFSIIKNWDGDYISNQCLPEDSTTITINNLLMIPIDMDGNSIPDSGINVYSSSLILNSSNTTYDVPSIDGYVYKDQDDWNGNQFCTRNTISTDWSGNSLDSLFITYDRYHLFIGIDGLIQNSSNVCLIYIDKDFGSSDNTGFNDNSDLNDNSGNLDNSITGNVPRIVQIYNFCADYVFGSTNAVSCDYFNLNDNAGLRNVETSNDFGWVNSVLRVTPDGDMEGSIPFNKIYNRGEGLVDTGAVLGIFVTIKNWDGDYISNQSLPEDGSNDTINYIFVLPIDSDSNGIPDDTITISSQGYIQSSVSIMLADSTEPPRQNIYYDDSLKIWIYASSFFDTCLFEMNIEGSSVDTFPCRFSDPNTNENPLIIIGSSSFETNWYCFIPKEYLNYQTTIVGKGIGIHSSTNETLTTESYKGKYTQSFIRSGVSKNKFNKFHTLRTDLSMEDWRDNERLGTDNPCNFYFTFDSLYFYANWNGFNPEFQKMNIAFDVNPMTDSGATSEWSGCYFGDNERPDYVVQLDATQIPPKVYVSKSAGSGWETASDSSNWLNWVEKVSFGFGEVRIPRSFFEGNADPNDTIGIFMWVENTSKDVWASFPLENDDSQDDLDPSNMNVFLGYEAVWYGTNDGDTTYDVIVAVYLTDFSISVHNGNVFLLWKTGIKFEGYRILRDNVIIGEIKGDENFFVDRPEPFKKYNYKILGKKDGKFVLLVEKDVFVDTIENEKEGNIFIDYLYTNIKDEEYSIFDISGRLVKSGISDGKISIKELSTGIYFLKYRNNYVKFLKVR